MATTSQKKLESVEKLHWQKVTLDLTAEELEIYREIARHFDESLPQLLVDSIRGSSKGILDNPEFLGQMLSAKLLARLNSIIEQAKKQEPPAMP